MTINRYQGNSGKVRRYAEPLSERPSPPPGAPGTDRPMPNARPVSPRGPLQALEGLGSLTRLLPQRLSDLETEDLILLLILYLMYRESGDSELLMIMGAMFLL